MGFNIRRSARQLLGLALVAFCVLFTLVPVRAEALPNIALLRLTAGASGATVDYASVDFRLQRTDSDLIGIGGTYELEGSRELSLHYRHVGAGSTSLAVGPSGQRVVLSPGEGSRSYVAGFFGEIPPMQTIVLIVVSPEQPITSASLLPIVLAEGNLEEAHLTLNSGALLVHAGTETALSEGVGPAAVASASELIDVPFDAIVSPVLEDCAGHCRLEWRDPRGQSGRVSVFGDVDGGGSATFVGPLDPAGPAGTWTLEWTGSFLNSGARRFRYLSDPIVFVILPSQGTGFQ